MSKKNDRELNTDKEVEIVDLGDKKHVKRSVRKAHEKELKREVKETKRKKRKYNKEFTVVTYSFLALFLVLTGYLIYFVQVKSDDFVNNSYNARLDLMDEYVIRGDILANDGTVLATTEVASDGTETRVYPYGSLFAHVIGYSSNGMSGVELDANYQLLSSNAFFLTRIKNEVLGEKNQGDSVITTLDVDLQQACSSALGSADGAVICIEPSTGKILAMVSQPTFNPNTIEDNWDSYVSDDSSSILVNRATQGLYAPGSTFKIFTLLEYLHESDADSFSFDCTGSVTLGDYTLHCINNTSHGTENLLQAFANSCNSAFATIGLDLDVDSYVDLCESLYFNKTLPTRLSNTATSSLTLSEDDSDSLLMQTAIGQGETMVSPLHMVMIVSAIANDGVLMEPYIVDSVVNDDGTQIKQYSSSRVGRLFSEEDAETLSEYMRYVVTDGTASVLNSSFYEAYGKTGTAEYSTDKELSRSWFVGYATNEDGKEIAIAVVSEDSDVTTGVSVASKVFYEYFSGE